MKAKVLIGALATLFVSYFVASPWLTLHELRSAVRNRNADAVAKHVDFPALRESLKTQMKTAMTLKAVKDEQSAALAAAFASSMTDQFVDALVTPEGLRQLMAAEAERSAPKTEPSLFDKGSASYQSLNRFAVTIHENGQDKGRVLLDRQGLSWKVVGIEIDPSQLNL